MLKIRLQRIGRRNHPEFRVVVTESTRGPKSGDFLEIVGSYNPHKDTTQIKADRVKHWMSQGAQVSDTVHNILVSEGVIEGKKKNVLPRKSPKVVEAEESPSEETPASSEEEAPAEDETTEEAAAEETKEEVAA